MVQEHLPTVTLWPGPEGVTVCGRYESGLSNIPHFWGSPSAGRSFLQYLELGVVEVGEHDLVGGVAAVLLCCILILEQTEQLAAVRRVQIRRVVQVSSPNLLNTGCFWWSDCMFGLSWDRGVSRAGGQPLWLPTALTGWWNISNLRQPKHLQDHQNNLEVTDNEAGK